MSAEQVGARGGPGIGDTAMLFVAAGVAAFAVALWMGRARGRTPEPERMSATAWTEIAAIGTPLSASKGTVRVVIFSDFQCPYCALLAQALSEVDSTAARQAEFLFRHYPLEPHEFALEAAIAAECAAKQGSFRSFHDLLFREQDSIGVKTFSAFAVQAGVADSSKFAECRSDAQVLSRVREDIAAGDGVPVTGTPTLVIEGEILRGAVGPETLADAIRRASTDL